MAADGPVRRLEDLLDANFSPLARDREDDPAAGIRRVHNYRLAGALPAVLTMRITRFNALQALLAGPVDGGQTLAIPAVLSGEGAAVIYDLTAFVVHRGASLRAGHYVSFARIGGAWYLFDDAAVFQISDAQALSELRHAYLISYQRRAGA